MGKDVDSSRRGPKVMGIWFVCVECFVVVAVVVGVVDFENNSWVCVCVWVCVFCLELFSIWALMQRMDCRRNLPSFAFGT